MASRQDSRARDEVRAKEIRAEEAARTAADELHDINKQRDENRTGIIGSIFQSVTGTFGSAKEAVTGRTHEATDKATIGTESNERERQNKQDATRKARETAREAKDYTVEKAKEAKDATMGKMDEYKDYTADKAKEAKDYTVDTSTQGKDGAVGKLSELKDKATHLFAGKNETDEEAKRKLETMHLKDKGYEAKGTRMDTTSASAMVTKPDPVRATAETFRKADQMSGQTFNDVGVMDEDDDTKGVKGGVYRVQLKHEKK